jgi:hypothetical protein
MKDRGHFSQKTPQNIFFFLALLTVGSCLRILEEHVQKVLQKLTTWIVRL